MKKVLKNISLVALLLIGFAILSHAIIPHDHHYELASNLEHNHNDKSPIHCHYLNHIDVDKITTNNFQKLVKHMPALMAVFSFDESNTSNIFVDFIQQKIINTFLSDAILSISPTRGSPIL